MVVMFLQRIFKFASVRYPGILTIWDHLNLIWRIQFIAFWLKLCKIPTISNLSSPEAQSFIILCLKWVVTGPSSFGRHWTFVPIGMLHCLASLLLQATNVQGKRGPIIRLAWVNTYLSPEPGFVILHYLFNFDAFQQIFPPAFLNVLTRRTGLDDLVCHYHMVGNINAGHGPGVHAYTHLMGVVGVGVKLESMS